MRLKGQGDLLLLNIITASLIIIITFLPANTIRIILGLPFLLFSPGYSLTAAFFPRKSQLDGIERLALSFGLSFALTPLTGIILVYSPWGISLPSALIFVAIIILATSLIACHRRHRLAESERFSVSWSFSLSLWDGQGLAGKTLSAILIVAILGSIGMLGYVIAMPKVGEQFTEFYLLGTDGEANEYPKELMVGEEAKIIVGIVNQEHEAMSYRVEVEINGGSNNEIGPIVLGYGDTKQEVVSFTPRGRGDNQKVEFLLYKSGQSQPGQSLRLWINVK